ncbi:MAG: cell division protein FtsZ [Bacteroidales bacterium]|nr:cell division protein FtsZ [Candidatus Hennigimonas equi]
MSDIKFIPENWIPENSNIKAIGVGGGGQNAVTYMYNQHIEGCTFIVCNTDSQALENSNVPIKIHLGKGLGAGCDPIKGRNAAEEAVDEIAEKVLDTGTEMLFITAGMGGGTGTGAAPVIAAMAKKRGILTVGVVTIPFQNEGRESIQKAINGIRELEKNVDSLLVIDNEKLYDVYGEMLAKDAYPKADEILTTAVRGIVEIIKKKGYVNVDMEDVKTMMRDSGVALMGIGTGTGKNRLEEAVKGAVISPLLNDFDLKTAKNILVNVTSGYNENGLLMKDLAQIDKLIESYTGSASRFKRGIVYEMDEDFGDKVCITVIATGFAMESLHGVTDKSLGNLIELTTDYEYTPDPETIHDVVDNIKIGPSDARNERRFNFTEAPTLCNYEGGAIAELEQTAAIKRIKH